MPSDATAIVNVTVIPMDSERVNAGQTVLVRGDRISAIGAAGELAVPPGATVIDGAGRYVVLTAGGVAAFLRRWQSARPRPSARLARIRVRAGIMVAAWVPAVVSATLFLAGRSAVRQRRATSGVHGSDPGGRRGDRVARGRDRRDLARRQHVLGFSGSSGCRVGRKPRGGMGWPRRLGARLRGEAATAASNGSRPVSTRRESP